MILKAFSASLVGMLVLASAGVSQADVYRPGEFLGLDLNRAAFSAKLLGPPTQFAPVPVEAKADPAIVAPAVKAPLARTARQHTPASPRIKSARRHGNPLDAQAFDARIQVWPCRTGGICNWEK